MGKPIKKAPKSGRNALLLAVIFFAGIVDDHGTMIDYLRGNAERLDREIGCGMEEVT